MEIIEKGNKTFECVTCGCKFILDGKDKIEHYYGIYSVGNMFLGDTTSKDYDYVLCPQCGKRVKVGGRGNIIS